MRLRDWTVPAAVLLCWGNVALSGSGPSTSTQIAARIRIQEARVPQIEALAARDREQVEMWYQGRRAALVQEIARVEVARLSLAERELWVQFAHMYLDRSYPPTYVNSGFVASYLAALLGQAMIQEYLISEMADLLAGKEFERKLAQIVEERLDVPLLPLLREPAAELLLIVRRVQVQVAMELTRLTNHRNARLGAIMEWENDLKEQVRGILEYLRQSESRPVWFGVVESVGYCPTSGYYCMIEGVDKVLAVGQRIGEIRVVKIDPEKVEFAKDGTTWAQALGAAPQPFWD